ncbi:DUF2125 domain-containing protein [Poseidonocella sedimentorum]|uniref:DUF2125 domain-containing protein n=1 Tax=Poseidonocella sedimentorum TaxID=871652 RepID=A0A1I6EA37_9RHOB|nr:DUF2125 domain-containing protein [Poseidonocella sedimentorum]SFR14358.1 hypothetical protein SAMN04515673_108126 [Poseidonocella sedimentorum]
MTRPILLAACITCLTAPAAFAELSPGDAWMHVTDQLGARGLHLVAEERRDGAALVMSDVALHWLDQSDPLIEIIGTFHLEPTSDGAVILTIPEPLHTMTFTETPSQRTYEFSGFEARFDGTPANAEISILSDSIASRSVVEVSLDSPARAQLTTNTNLRGLQGAITSALSEDASLDMDIRGESYRSAFKFSRGEDQEFDVTTRLSETVTSLSLSSPREFDFEAFNQNPFPYLPSTFQSRQGPMVVSGEFANAEGRSTIDFDTGPATVDFTRTPERMRLLSDGEDAALTVEGPLPGPPLSLSMERMGYRLELPGHLPEENQLLVAAFGMTLEGITLGEHVWAMFDPNRLLPRDPANLELELSASVPGARGPDGEFTFGQGGRVDLSQISLSALGAAVSLSGGLEFFDVEEAEGDLIASAEGLLPLIFSLRDAGLLPPETVGMVQMMLPGFATKVGPNRHESRITLTRDGSVTVNGTQIR